MKEVIAIIRIGKINPTKEALLAAGFSGLHAKDVLGRGKGFVDILRLNGAEKHWEEKMDELAVVGRLIPKRMISMIIPDNLVKRAVQTILSVNSTGKSGDGKIFVVPVADSIRIRDGAAGADTLDS